MLAVCFDFDVNDMLKGGGGSVPVGGSARSPKKVKESRGMFPEP